MTQAFALNNKRRKLLIVQIEFFSSLKRKENSMAIIHKILAKVTKEGVAKLVYAHPSIQKTSLILNNRTIITQPVDSIIQMSIKMMPSGKRILLSSGKVDYKSIREFIDNVGEDNMKKQAEREGTPIPSFDGVSDKDYIVIRRALPYRIESEVTAGVEEVEVEEVEEENQDGFTEFAELLVPEVLIRATQAAFEVAKTQLAANVLLIGPSGNGKTSFAKAFADMNGLQFLKVNCSVVRDPEEWFGYREARDGSTVFVPTDFTTMVQKGNVVILLDEINRLESYLHNSLMPLLDETRQTQVHGETITVGKNVVFFATMNIGAGFVGTFLLDNAIKNRMDCTLSMPKLPVDREVDLLIKRTGISADNALNVVAALEKIREAAERNEIDIDVSTRSSLKIARLVATGKISLKEALTIVVFNNAESAGQAKALIDSLT